MTETTDIAYSTSTINLRRLAMIRSILVGGLLCLIAYAYFGLGASLNYTALLAILLAMAGGNALTLWLSRQTASVNDRLYFSHLLVDVLGLSALLYFTGGGTNPFVSYYLVPLCISAALLPARFTWALAATSLVAYSLLMVQYQPLQALTPDSGMHHQTFNVHIVGMWINFMASAALITFFVVKMAETLRDQRQELIDRRERAMRNDHIISIATMAAATAHELGTPMSTMSIVLEDMLADPVYPKEDIELLQQQLAHCKQRLQQLVVTAESHQHGERGRIPLNQYVEQLLEQWQLMRPTVKYELKLANSGVAPEVPLDPTLGQAITNLLNNAAEACRQSVSIRCSWDEQRWQLEIIDDGPGIAQTIGTESSLPITSTKKDGMGLGLFLSNAIIQRYGGELSIAAIPSGGTRAFMDLPINHA
ncbi:MAG: ATP-binding protein [Halioglobus sp.]